MAGTDEDAVAAADDALYVLTAALLTPAKFPSVLGDDYPEACAALGLAPLVDGYGLVFGQDGSGARWTVVIDDVSLVAVAIASWDCGMEYDLSPDERTVMAALPGWPLAIAVAAPGVPAPHDPDPEIADGPPLAPPDTSTWGSAQRRLGADEIALQWAMWREQIDDSAFPSPNGGSAMGAEPTNGETAEGATANGPASDGVTSDSVTSGGDASDRDVSALGASAGDASRDGRTGGDPSQDERTGGEAAEDGTAEDGTPGDRASGHRPSGNGTSNGRSAGDSARDDNAMGSPPSSAAEKPAFKGHSGVRRVLAEARAYVDSPPPLGRVRSSFASGDARTLRADGPGWSLVARTGDIAFVLLDDEPGEVLPVGRGPELPGLLEALDKMAVRPS